MDLDSIKALLEAKAEEYEQEDFIRKDPVCIPHLFSKKQDIEIAGFLAAILAWGNRTSIINSCQRILSYMDRDPYTFILHHQEEDLKPMLGFVHRTFNATDLLYVITWMQWFYRQHASLEAAFFPTSITTTEAALTHFHHYFFSLPDAPARTRKHISTPAKKSACKRLNMFLRWMVRKDSPVDFGIWHTILPAQLMIPLDTHSSQVARKLGILSRMQNDWKAVEELMNILRLLDAVDPVKYDYALFALGAEERYRFKPGRTSLG